MNLRLERIEATDAYTIGQLAIEGAFECWTLEDPVRRGEKVPGDTAIPAGRYRVTVSMSARFKKRLPLLLDVPNFAGVRIHSGNTTADTRGCVLVGADRGAGEVHRSREAFAALFWKIEGRDLAAEEIWIDIVDAGAST